MRGLDKQVVIITGAAGGIGQAICQRYVEEGANVIACDIDEAGLTTLADGTTGNGSITPHVLDITDLAAAQAVAAAVMAEHGCIDALVNNAGWDIAKPFLETEPDLWEKIIAINLYGPLNMHKAVLPHMVEGGGGKVVNIASDAGRVGSSGESVYSACKGGLVAFTKTIAREYARKEIRINAVCPGPTDTPLLRSFVGDDEYGQKIYEGLKRAIPLKRLGQPDDLSGIVAFLTSDDAEFMTGQVVSVSGGLTMHG